MRQRRGSSVLSAVPASVLASVFALALAGACSPQSAEDPGTSTARGSGGNSASSGTGGSSSGTGGSSSGTGGSSASGTGGSSSGTGGSSASGTGGSSASGTGGSSASGTGGSSASGTGGSASGTGGSASGTGGSSGADAGGGSPAAATFKKQCQAPVMTGWSPDEFCEAYGEICTFGGAQRYKDLADCKAKFKGFSSDADGCKAGHLCRAFKEPGMKEADCASSSGAVACRN